MRSTRARLTLLFTLLVAAALVFFDIGVYVTVVGAWDAEMDRRLELEHAEFKSYFLDEYDEFRRGVHAKLEPELEEFCRLSGTRVAVRAMDGSFAYASPGLVPGTGDASFRSQIDGVPFRGARGRVLGPGGREFAIEAAISELDWVSGSGSLRFYLGLFTVLAVGLSSLVGRLYIGRALAPVEAMRRHAERISRENLAERIPQPPETGEFRNLALTLNEMLDRLGSTIAGLERFAADAAHEIRTPLANLRAQIEHVMQEKRTTEQYEAALASLSEDVFRMTRIVGNLFLLAQLDQKEYELRMEPVSVAGLLAETRETWEEDAGRRGIRIEAIGADVTVRCDALALRRVLFNLVENAVKYSRSGGRIVLSAEKENGTARIGVRDFGVGIPPEHQSRLFQRFYRVDRARSRDTGGAGLGLAICKSLVEAQQGRISVRSEPGQGSVFSIELPAHAESFPAGEAPSPAA